jgi:uncharacterized membrane protein YeaQ/YmgE (transglycosylase-associated protein family)
MAALEVLIIAVIIGIIAGWLAGLIMKGHGFGLVMNAVLGVIGSFVGSFAFDLVGLHATSFLGNIVKATVGAVIVLAIANFIRSRR